MSDTRTEFMKAAKEFSDVVTAFENKLTEARELLKEIISQGVSEDLTYRIKEYLNTEEKQDGNTRRV